jgi:ubiquinone/menaquinone biosynthesis C-methylase UbiE
MGGIDVKESIRQQFGRVAAGYATSAVHAAGPNLEAMLAAWPLRGDERVLDAGTGTGHTALAFAPRVGQVVAVDLTEPMLAQGRRLAEERGLTNVAFEHADVERLPFADASFDLVTNRFSAHHFPQPRTAVRELARVLKAGGALLIVDVYSPETPATDTYLNAVEVMRDPSHVRDHSLAQWQEYLETVGLAGEVLETWPLRIQFDEWVARMETPSATAEQIRRLFDVAPIEVREALRVEVDHSFSFPVALLRARK